MAAEVTPRLIDIERDVTFTPDIRGDSLLVHWRGVPVGYIRCIRSAPRMSRLLSAQARAEIRQKYLRLVGKWGSDQLSEVCDSRDQAAALLIAQQIEKSDSSPLMHAALRNDAAEVSRLLNEIADGVDRQGAP